MNQATTREVYHRGRLRHKPPRPPPNPIVRYAVVIGLGVLAAAVLAFVAIGFLFPQTLSNPKQEDPTNAGWLRLRSCKARKQRNQRFGWLRFVVMPSL